MMALAAPQQHSTADTSRTSTRSCTQKVTDERLALYGDRKPVQYRRMVSSFPHGLKSSLETNLGESLIFSHLEPSVAYFKKQFPEGRNTLTYNVTHPGNCSKSKHQLESALTSVRYQTSEVISVGQAIKPTRAPIHPPPPWPEYV